MTFIFLLNTTFVAHFLTMLAFTYLRYVIDENEILFVHAYLAHLALVHAFSALVKMMFEHLVETI